MRRHAWRILLIGCLVLPRLAWSATFYVDGSNGADANPGSQALPWRTLTKGVNTINAGDTLYIRAGTYVSSGAALQTTPTSTQQIPSGTSWATATRISAFPTSTPSGCDPRGSDALTVSSACQGTVYEPVTLQVTSTGSNVVLLRGGINQFPGVGLRYIIFEGVNTLGGSFPVSLGTYGGLCGTPDDSPDHIRLLNMQISGGRSSGIFADHWGRADEFINLDVHHNGASAKDHGIYIAGIGHKIIGGAFHHNSGYGLHLYHAASDDPCATPEGRGGGIAERLRLYGNRNGGVIGQYTFGWIIRNNLVYGNELVGFNVGNGQKIYNNTIWANGGVGIEIAGTTNTSEVKNTITDGLANSGATGLILGNNLTSTTADHKFVDSANGDFRLQTGSDAINTGQAIAAVIDDFAGISRPQGSAYEIGAHEFSSVGTPAAPTINVFTANPPSITSGNTSTLNWDAANATSGCSINQGIGQVCANATACETGGGTSTGVLTTTTVYTLTCTNASGNDTAQATVTINAAGPTINVFAASPSTIQEGNGSTLSWDATDAVSGCSINQGIGQVCATATACETGGATIVVPSTTTTYTLTCVNGSGSPTAQATVTVVPETPPAFDFTVSATSLGPLRQQSSVTSSIQIGLLSGTAGAVTLTGTGLPSGASVVFSPASCTPPCSSTATFEATPSTAAGTYAVNITGTSGSVSRAAPLSLAVFCQLSGDCP